MAADSVSMQEPVCFINNEEDGGLSVQQEALTILQKIQQPAVVVAIVGLYRTGKSYLMNRLAGKQTGFALGNTVESKTKGIWMWCVPHPSKTGHTLVLLDTEGLGDVSKGDSKHDTKIFALAILLSSTLVYNSRGTIDNKTIEELQYVTELTQYIKIRSDDDKGKDSEFVKFFPNFIWAVRDFTLQLNIGGQRVTPDGYLEDSLKLKSGCAKTVTEHNLPRESIRKYFPSRRCFTFSFPTNPDNMADLENLNSDELSANFRKVTEDFCTFVFNDSQVKLLKDGHKVTGKVLGDLAQAYVESISRGDMPCLENAVVTISGIENKAAVEDGVQVYQSGMEQLKQRFPLELEAVTSEHQRLSSMATKKFMERCFKDDEGVFIKSLETSIDQHFKKYLQNNEEASKRTCRELLGRLSTNMTDQLQNGFYTKPGGYELYRKDMDKIVEEYNSQTNNSVKSEDVLEKFLKNMSETSDQIRQADTKLNEKEKQICEEKEKSSLLEQKMAAEMEEKQKLEAIMKAEKETYEDRMKQMEEKNEEEKKQKEEEFQRALESKMAEQKIMLEKGFEEQEKKLRQEIKLSEEEHRREKEELQQRHEETMTLMKQLHEQNAAQMNQNISQLVDVLKVQQQEFLAMQPPRDSTGCFSMNCKPIPCSVL